MWKLNPSNPSPPSYPLPLPFPTSSPHLLTLLPSAASTGDLLLIVSDDGHLSWWREPTAGHAATPPSSSLTHLPLSRDESCTYLTPLPPSTSPHTTLVVGTTRGRLFSISLSLQATSAPTVHSVRSSSTHRRGLLSSLASLLPWSGPAESDGEVRGVVWWRHEGGEGVWTLHPTGLRQWSVDEDGIALLWSSPLTELAEEGETIDLLSLASSSSSLFVLYRRDDGEEETAHVAEYPVDFSADAPFESYSSVLPLPSSLASASQVGVSQRSDVLLYAWSDTGLAQLNASNLSAPPSSFTFPSSLVLGGGMLVDSSAARLGNPLPSYDHANPLLLCLSYGVRTGRATAVTRRPCLPLLCRLRSRRRRQHSLRPSTALGRRLSSPPSRADATRLPCASNAPGLDGLPPRRCRWPYPSPHSELDNAAVTKVAKRPRRRPRRCGGGWGGGGGGEGGGGVGGSWQRSSDALGGYLACPSLHQRRLYPLLSVTPARVALLTLGRAD